MKKSSARKNKSILFICTGNTCRSPMAAAFFQKLVDEKNIKTIEVKSAGVCTIAGLLATQESIQLLEAEGVDLKKHRSRQLTEDMVKKTDLILGMTPYHIQTAYRISPFARGKTYIIMEYTKTDLKNPQIPDPMGCTFEVYKKCFSKIKKAVRRLMKTEFVTSELPKEKKPTKTSPAAAAANGATKRTSANEKVLYAEKPALSKSVKVKKNTKVSSKKK